MTAVWGSNRYNGKPARAKSGSGSGKDGASGSGSLEQVLERCHGGKLEQKGGGAVGGSYTGGSTMSLRVQRLKVNAAEAEEASLQGRAR